MSSDNCRRDKPTTDLDFASYFYSASEEASQSSSWLSSSACSRSCLDQVVSLEVDVTRRTSCDGDDVACLAIPTSLTTSKCELGDASLLDHDDSAASIEQTLMRGQAANSVPTWRGGIKERQTTETEMCLVCSTEMSIADPRYPMKCPGRSCDFNFCLRCAEEFLTSSKDDYHMAIDGSRQVEIHLRCPNCRRDISTQKEEITHKRSEFFHLNEDPCTPAPTPLSAVDASLLGSKFDPNNNIATGVYLNRSGATRSARTRRLEGLLESIDLKPIPVALMRARESEGESLTLDETSKDKTRGLSLSSPPLPRSTFESPMKKLSASSPALRRIKSSQELRTPSCPSPRSILDFASSDRKGESLCDAYDGTGRLGDCAINISVPSRASCLELTVEGGLLGQNFDWCCSAGDMDSSIDSMSIKETTIVPKDFIRSEEGCEGYHDYSGTFHPCTAATDKIHGPCQGCIFRRGMHGYKSEESELAELYYDSDPGPQFTMSLTCPSRASIDEAPIGMPLRERSRQCPKFPWRRKAKNSMSSTKETRSIARQTSRGRDHLYDCFPPPQLESNDLIEMGPLLPKETQIGDNVQEALNSKWVLQWHITPARDAKVRTTHAPKIVELWIERGYRRNRTEIVEPQLMWSNLYQPDLFNKRKLTGSALCPYRLSLFAIRRVTQIEDIDSWDRLKMSVPRPLSTDLNQLLVVRSRLGDDFIFEASCAEESLHIVNSLKIVSARLMSHAVVGKTTRILTTDSISFFKSILKRAMRVDG
ncbi:hypothetical protein THAOC_04419 [Thalassiosira oceanica]|uniref:C2H2-type domain-containing protein n=1 Tax=Thalassiosira oceanica TaxID=159749 RepID=K0T8N2_THAOC|nr:hypothetical protein THAOC_04419 [Thalassiosira oceanica]|eukprot:EJK73935.1 hypothetical protein THAOC_04419 [Thalassiosira oceanica]